MMSDPILCNLEILTLTPEKFDMIHGPIKSYAIFKSMKVAPWSRIAPPSTRATTRLDPGPPGQKKTNPTKPRCERPPSNCLPGPEKWHSFMAWTKLNQTTKLNKPRNKPNKLNKEQTEQRPRQRQEWTSPSGTTVYPW